MWGEAAACDPHSKTRDPHHLHLNIATSQPAEVEDGEAAEAEKGSSENIEALGQICVTKTA